jgi:hypothetical protein
MRLTLQEPGTGMLKFLTNQKAFVAAMTWEQVKENLREVHQQVLLT